MKITYAVEGMHCQSCEVLIEDKIMEFAGVKKVVASTKTGQVVIEYEKKAPKVEELNQMFGQKEYTFTVPARISKQKNRPTATHRAILTALAIFAGFLLLNRLGWSNLVNVNTDSALPAFFVLGVLAGVSTCAALLSGLILSLPDQDEAHWQFYIGRLIAYTVFGALLGAVGQRLQLSLTLGAFLVVGVSGLMILQGLKLLGWQVTTIALPKKLTRGIFNRGPAIMGALTVLLPCGFTITAEGLALITGQPMRSAGMMGLFAFGTLPGLMLARISLAKLGGQVAGVLIILFALFNVNSQFNVLGLPSISNVAAKNQIGQTAQNGKVQVIKMEANNTGYKPNYFKVRVNQPVRWEITDTGTSGCTNAIIARNLFAGQVALTPGETSVKEFTPTKTGQFRFSCWMGMVTGIIEVVETNQVTSVTAEETAQIPAGGGCGCGQR
jgi:sulfite exporter TauE/SafE/copper chaperone CopZ